MILRLESFEPWVLAYLLNSLWQIPLVFLAALIAARIARPAGPRIEHRVWVAAIMLEAVLPLCNFHLNELWQRASSLALWLRAAGSAEGQTRVLVSGGSPYGVPLPWLSATLLGSVAAIYLGVALYFAGRLVWGLWITESMRRHAVALHLPQDVLRNLQHFERIIGISIAEGSVEIASTSAISGPAAVGIRRPTLLLPPAFLDRLGSNEVDAVFAHEIAHIERGDFLKNLLFGILSVPIAYHPLLALTRTRLAESREMVCDSMAAEAIGGRDTYARSLLRLASLLADRAIPRALHAIGIFDANIFERRVMNLTRRNLPLKTASRISIAAACAVLACATCVSAIAMRMEVNEPNSQNPPTNPKSIHVKATSLDIVSKVQPVFPPEEKTKAKASGTRIDAKVLLDVVIGKDGSVKDIKVSRSMGENFDKSAVDAVKQWKWKPYLLNGDPVEVESTITIIYSLKP